MPPGKGPSVEFFDVGGLPFLCSYPDPSWWYIRSFFVHFTLACGCVFFLLSFLFHPAGIFFHPCIPSISIKGKTPRNMKRERNKRTKGPVTIHTRTRRHTPHPAQPAPCLCSTSRPFSRLANHSAPLLSSYMKQKSITLRAGHTNKPVP